MAPERDGEFWRALTEASPDVVLVVDTSGTILYVNRIVPALAGRELVGAKIWLFAIGDALTRLTAKIREVTETCKAIVYEHPGMRADGSSGWYEVRAVPVLVSGRVDRIIWASTDISERKQLEEHLRQSQKMEAIGLLAGGVAHDFNNLLAVIMGTTELALRMLGSGHPAEPLLQETLEATQRGADLTRKLLAFSRKQVSQPRVLDVGATVADLTRMIRRIVGEDVEMVIEAAPGALMIHADPVQLEQVIMNLCMNARQAMPSGGVLRLSTGTAEFDATFVAKNQWAKAGRFAAISVKDAGVGMDETTQARMFEPFFTTKNEGTGLGLSTVYGVVQQHDGFLRVESRLGEGTCISVYLPTVDGATLPEAHGPSSAPLSEPMPSGGVVLLAEDEPSVRALVKRVLTELGYTVLAVENGLQAVEAFELSTERIALVILDVVMPHLGGQEAYERIRLLRPDTKVLFTTGYAPDSGAFTAFLASEEFLVLEKPFTSGDLSAMVQRALDR